MKFKFQVADSTTSFKNRFQLYIECLTFYLTGVSPVFSSSFILVDVKHNLWVTCPAKTVTLHNKTLRIRDWHVPGAPATQSTPRGAGTQVFQEQGHKFSTTVHLGFGQIPGGGRRACLGSRSGLLWASTTAMKTARNWALMTRNQINQGTHQWMRDCI